MYRLSFTKHTKVRVLPLEGGPTELVPIDSLVDFCKVVDWYGEVRNVKVEGQTQSNMHLFKANSGETLAFGAEHTVLCRKVGSPRYERLSVSDIEKPVFVRLPQRKIAVADCVSDALDSDKTGLFLAPKAPSELMPMMEGAATAGLLVMREKAELRIYLEARRPACFVGKLTNGNFQADLEDTLGGLVSKAIVQPHGPFNSRYIEQTKRFGTICEGSSLYNDVFLIPVSVKDSPVTCYNLTVDDEDTPVETTWFCT